MKSKIRGIIEVTAISKFSQAREVLERGMALMTYRGPVVGVPRGVAKDGDIVRRINLEVRLK